MALLACLDAQIDGAEAKLAQPLPDTPFAPLTTVPGWGPGMSARSDSGLRPDRLRRAVREATGQIDGAKRVAAAFARLGARKRPPTRSRQIWHSWGRSDGMEIGQDSKYACSQSCSSSPSRFTS
jgi:hypothetical protein